MVKFEREKILNLVNDRLKGKIMLPEIQRRFVWKPRQVLGLIDSLKKDYPIGSFLVWKTEDEIETRAFDNEKDNVLKKYTEISYLLDGQQRLTSIVYTLLGEKIRILYNLEDDKVYLEKSSNRNDNRYLLISSLFINDDNQLKRATLQQLQKILEKKGYSKEAYINYMGKLLEIQELFEKDVSLLIVDKNRNYDDVAEIFIRINSRGVYINKQDLAYAKITLAVPGISKGRINPTLLQFEKHGFPFTPGFLVKLMVAIETNQTKSMLSENIWHEKHKSKINEKWDIMVEALKMAVDFLKTEVGIINREELTSEKVIVLLAYMFSKKMPIDTDTKLRKKVIQWIYSVQLWARYSGSSETLVDRDLKIIESNEPNKALNELMTELNPDSRIINAEMFKTHSKNSPAFKIFYLIMKKRLGERETSKMVMSLLNKKEDHHLFPKKLLKKQKLDERLINDIANLTFISKKSNLNISDKDPQIYFQNLWDTEGETFFDRHLIPKDKNLWKIENYEQFIKKRRELIVEELKLFMDNLK